MTDGFLIFGFLFVDREKSREQTREEKWRNLHSTALHNRRLSNSSIPASLLDPNVDPVPRGTFNPHKDAQDLEDARFDEMDEEMGVGMSSQGSHGGGGFGGLGAGIGGGGTRDLEGMEDGMMQHEQGYGATGGVEDAHAELVSYILTRSCFVRRNEN